MLRKEDLKEARVEFTGSAKIILPDGKTFRVRLSDGTAFEGIGHRLDDGNEKGEKALRNLVKRNLFSSDVNISVMKEESQKSQEEGRAFKFSDSFLLTAQIPDETVGCSGSRCANCGKSTAYCDQICRNCKLPFVGPSSFPQWPAWNLLLPDEKKTLVQKVFVKSDNRGRLLYANVESIPLTLKELDKIEKLDDHDAASFYSTHEIKASEIRKVFLF